MPQGHAGVPLPGAHGAARASVPLAPFDASTKAWQVLRAGAATRLVPWDRHSAVLPT